MTAPFRSLGGLKRASLVTLGRSAFPLRSVLIDSDTNPHIMYPKRGANTPEISEHHRKHTSGSLQRIKPSDAPGSKQRVAHRKGRRVQTLQLWRSSTLWFTVEMEQLGCFYARPPCALEECLYVCSETGLTPASVRILGAWSVWKFSPVRCTLQKVAHVNKVCWSAAELLKFFES